MRALARRHHLYINWSMVHPMEKKKEKKKAAHGQNRDSSVDTVVFHAARDLFTYSEVK